MFVYDNRRIGRRFSTAVRILYWVLFSRFFINFIRFTGYCF